MRPEFDTQAAKNPAWRINLDAWEHFPKPGQVVPAECDIRPHYNGEGQWECARCDVRVRVHPVQMATFPTIEAAIAALIEDVPQ